MLFHISVCDVTARELSFVTRVIAEAQRDTQQFFWVRAFYMTFYLFSLFYQKIITHKLLHSIVNFAGVSN